jgi:hypothetical protein
MYFSRNALKLRVGPEIKRGAGWRREGAFDFLDLFGSFWGDAKKNRTFEVKLRFNLRAIFWFGLLFQQALPYFEVRQKKTGITSGFSLKGPRPFPAFFL